MLEGFDLAAGCGRGRLFSFFSKEAGVQVGFTEKTFLIPPRSFSSLQRLSHYERYPGERPRLDAERRGGM